jgi:translation initiation factor IF-2
MRVHELARELLTTSKDLLDRIREHNWDVKTAASALTPEQIEQLRSFYAQMASDHAQATEQALATEEQPAPAADAAEKVPEEAPPPPPPPPEQDAPTGPIVIKQQIVVKELAELLQVKPNLLIAKLMSMNIFASINEKIDFKTAQMLAEKHGRHLELEKKEPEKKVAPPAPPPPPPPVEVKVDRTPQDEDVPRPPIVTFLGHVDHGKTSLLDKIRSSKVASGEHGGITQHIGAYTVEYNDQKISFIDTPGHAAFTSMRARGANLTDIAVIIVAADEGIMTQTREAIQHARAANVTIMVAINKIDLRNANVDRVKQQLQAENLSPEDWGGDVIVCPVSAETGEGVDHLLEMILLQAEILELRANPKKKASGYVIEARLEPGMGPTANILVKDGTLHVGDTIICGSYWGRVKALINDTGAKVRTAGPSMPVKCLGLNNVPDAGSAIETAANDKEARAITELRTQQERLEKLGTPKRKTSLDDLLRQTDFSEKKTLNVVAKADVQGTLEAVLYSLSQIHSEKVALEVVLSGVGNISENDVILASASDAIIVGFNVSRDNAAAAIAKREGVEIRLYSIIYELIDDIRSAMTGLLTPVTKENVIGQVRVRQIFDIGRTGRIAGCMVTSGRIHARARGRVKRGSDVVFEGPIASLKRYQNDAAEVRDGQECGIRLENFSGYEEGDIIEFFEVQQIAQEL